MRRAAIASVGVSLLLVGLKTFAFFATYSVAMLASLADSALDLFTATLNLFAVRSALTPADAEHRFGHGKAEPLAGLAQGAFIAASAMFLVIQAVERLIAPQPVPHSLLALGVMGISILCAIALILYERRVVDNTGSVAIAADRTQYLADLTTNCGVIVALFLSAWMHWELADPLIALLVAAVLVWSAWSVFVPSYDQLMDHELPESDRERIKAIVRGHPQVRSLHDLRTRSAGLNTFIQLHLELDPRMELLQAHAVSDAVERDVCYAFPGAEIIIHQDPAGVETPPALDKT